ncbi:helix-turn-helix domain-containing protein [Paenibacillus macerans]|uniref:Cupin domain protein n=1 Tax=Paenibacillus macerans TaxID=44252 RepID=A0A090ZFW0_PAEMA|nr:AraC family transcriptional regulator [Paenibacillus macerans]KFN10214.1 cupin domain protein [Paenibacillus macerans]MCY7561010.1 AraC family transcriptional regulator [Paenibacillus macerans]MEC0153571.1 AraC family transcriptional regulator [Paenibacillus macerans]MUG25543.1 helix-turn-helix domain-containing protein [Paenibacillus macerans]UMV47169.1 AraC family transcriptional regulator [Paenibacillus macerans]
MDQALRRALHENKSHGTQRLPFGTYWYRFGPGEHVIDCHWHEEAEFFYCLEGETLFQVDTDYFPVRAGEAVFIDGGDIHAAHALGEQGCTFFSLVFDTQLLASAHYDAVQENLVLPLQERKATFPRHIRREQPYEIALLEHILAMMRSCSNETPGYEGAVKGHLYLMLAEIAAEGRAVSRIASSRSESSKIERLKTVILHIQQNYGHPIRLGELAALIPMSEGQFCRFFKSMTRQTPIDYINSYRIRQATELLREPERKISDIALEVGYDNISYFIRVFRKTMNCSPSEFRKKLQEPVEA